MDWLTAVWDYYTSSRLGLVELGGSFFSLLSVWFAFRHSQLTWFFGAVGVLFYGYLFWAFNLPADAALQFLFYVPVQLFGWYSWRGVHEQAQTRFVAKGFTTWTLWVPIVSAILALALTTGYFTERVFGSQYAFWDALLVWSSVFAQVLMVKKYWESWVLWVTVDLIAPVVYYNKELYVAAGVYVVFLVVASLGLYDWYTRYRLHAYRESIRMTPEEIEAGLEPFRGKVRGL